CEFVVLLGTMGDAHEKLQSEVNALDELKELSEQQGVKLAIEEHMALSTVHDVHQEFQNAFAKGEEHKEAQHNRMVGALHKEAGKLENDCGQTFNDLGTGIVVDETTETQAALQRLDIVGNTVDVYKQRKQVLERYRGIIGLDEIQYNNFSKCSDRYDHRVTVWTLLQKFTSDAAKWRATAIEEIDADAVASGVASVAREAGILTNKDAE
ncbi:MAG: hypothetical protein EZS28_055148, partial [Streblomastix strix]